MYIKLNMRAKTIYQILFLTFVIIFLFGDLTLVKKKFNLLFSKLFKRNDQDEQKK